jgi:hypothetical protein
VTDEKKVGTPTHAAYVVRARAIDVLEAVRRVEEAIETYATYDPNRVDLTNLQVGVRRLTEVAESMRGRVQLAIEREGERRVLS